VLNGKTNFLELRYGEVRGLGILGSSLTAWLRNAWETVLL
jgi:hypothetical protein